MAYYGRTPSKPRGRQSRPGARIPILEANRLSDTELKSFASNLFAPRSNRGPQESADAASRNRNIMLAIKEIEKRKNINIASKKRRTSSINRSTALSKTRQKKNYSV